jgi:hypothetical protein
MSGAYALDWTTIIRVADDLGIRTDIDFYSLLHAYEGTLMREARKKQKK